jgi:hypothetical protein
VSNERLIVVHSTVGVNASIGERVTLSVRVKHYGRGVTEFEGIIGSHRFSFISNDCASNVRRGFLNVLSPEKAISVRGVGESGGGGDRRSDFSYRLVPDHETWTATFQESMTAAVLQRFPR